MSGSDTKQDRNPEEQKASAETSASQEQQGSEADKSTTGEEAAEREQEGGQSSASSLEAQLAEAIAERDANYQRAVRIQAELENFRKRTRREQEESRRYQLIPFVRDLLPALDNLRRAVEAAGDSSESGELVKGVEMVIGQIEEILANYSVVPIEAIGSDFDPNRHEAVQQVPSAEHPPMTVIGEVQRGYILDERVVRPSQVIVSSGPPEPSADEAESES